MITLGVKPRLWSRHMYDHDKVFKHITFMTVFKGTHSHCGSQARHGQNSVFKHIACHDSIRTQQQWFMTVFKHDTVITQYSSTFMTMYSRQSITAQYSITQYHDTVFKHSTIMTVFKGTHSHGGIQAQHGHNTVFKYSHDTVFKHTAHSWQY